MNRDRWLLLISILIFVGLAVYYLSPGLVALLIRKKTSSIAARSSAPQPLPQGFTGRSFAEVKVKGEVVDDQTPWGRNPFLTEEEAGGKSPGSDGLQVKTIIMGQPKPVATVDGRTVVVGEKVGEETVKEIRPDAVVLERDGRKRVLKVREPSISVEVKEKKK
ncbi:MAG: hypothetical protein ACE5JO_03010 [Candidatus Binatia bacterium]